VSAKIPPDAFDFYASLGPSRSYQAVAARYGVSKRAVVKLALRERWTERMQEIQEKVRVENDKKMVENLQEMQERHMKLLRGMAVRVAQAIKEYPLTTCMEAIRAGEILIKMERIISGEPSERTELSVEEITKREIETLLRRVDVEGEDDPGADSEQS
jgi:hypothetical protein